jgi:hypothetical protein
VIQHRLWWVVLLMSAALAALNLWMFIHDQQHWNLDVAIITVLTAATAFYQLRREKRR